MGVLDNILAYKAQKDAQANADINAIPQGIAAFTAAKQVAQKSELDRLGLNVSAASHGLRIGPGGEITRDESLQDPNKNIDNLVKVLGLKKTLYDLGMDSGGTGMLGSNGELNIPQTNQAQPQATPGSGQLPGQLVPKEFDRFGRPTGYEVVKPSEAEKKSLNENAALKGQFGDIIDLFDKGNVEVDTVFGQPKAGKVLSKGTKEIVRGKQSNFMAWSGDDRLQTAAAYNDKMEGFVTVAAKSAGEQRPTDEDVKRFKKGMPGYDKPEARNKILKEQLMKDLESKDLATIWRERVGGDVTSKTTESNKSKPTDLSSMSTEELQAELKKLEG